MVRRGYESLTREDLDAWLEDCSPDIELHELAEIPDSAVYRGHDEVRRWAGSVRELVVSWDWAVEEILLERDDRVVVQARVSGEGRSGVPLDMVVFHVFDVSGGQVVRIRGFLDRDRALEVA
jgi:ketosteroid isomerase-like protein